MSLLVEIASRADVSLEAVVRVLTREPVSDADHARVLAVLDSLDAEQTRVLERFALAAVHDTLPRPQPVLEARVVEPERVEEVHTALQAPSAAAEPAPLVQLGSVLSELAEAVRELRRETDTERRERVDDLAVLIDLITNGWEGLDRRLGRLERQLARLEGGEATSRVLPARVEPPPVPGPPGPPEPSPPEPPPPPPPDGDGRARFAGKVPLVMALALGIGVGAVAALDLPSRSDVSTVVSASTREEPTARRTAPSRPPSAPRTSSVLGEAATETRPETEPEAEPNTAGATNRERPAVTTAPPAATSAPARSTQARTTAATTPARTTAPSSPGFRPSRTWAWPPVGGADYYLVEFFRAGERIYRGRPTRPQLRLPASVAFTPGVYRWTVRPGFGDPAENDLRAPIVDSGFTVGD